MKTVLRLEDACNSAMAEEEDCHPLNDISRCRRTEESATSKEAESEQLSSTLPETHTLSWRFMDPQPRSDRLPSSAPHS